MKKSNAILFMILSVMAFSIMNTIVKYLNNFSVYQIVFFRSFGTLLFTVPLILKNKIPFLGNNKKWLIIRGVAGVISITCFFQSLNYLPLGTAVSLRYTSPIFAAIFAFLFLKEKVKIAQWFLFFLAFIGVAIIKGFALDINTLGLALVFLSAISLGVIFVVIRKIGDSENSLIIVNYFMTMALVFGGIMSIFNWVTPSFTDLLLLISLGVFGYVGQIYMTKAFQYNETNIIAPLKYLEVVFMIIIGFGWFNEIYNLWTLIGVCLILFSLLYNIKLKRK